MISSLISGASFTSIILDILYSIPAIIIAISFHEFAHALMAYWLGDNTAKYQGRLTVNPRVHFDLYGALCMLIFGFGWANPVPFNYRNLKHPKRDSALIALAGPVMNFLVALAAVIIEALLVGILYKSGIRDDSAIKVTGIVAGIIGRVYLLNIGLMIFNLLPIPPLDGSKILFSFLPARSYRFILNYERYGSLILIVLLCFGFLDVPLMWLRGIVLTPLAEVSNFVINLFI